MKKTPNLLVDSIPHILLKLGIPMIFGIFFILFFMLVDVFFIAQIGEKELAAVGFAIPIISTIDSIILGFGVATTVVVSRIIGKGEYLKAKRVGVHAIIITFSIVTVFSLLSYLSIDLIFQYLGVPIDLYDLLKKYMFLSFFGLVSLVPPLIGNSVMRAHGNTMVPAIAMLIAALMNAVLDPVLIFGLFGAPELGMNGAAIATIIARLTGFCYVSYNLIHKFMIFDIAKEWVLGFKQSIRSILHTAIPAATASIVPPVTAIFLTSMIARYGSEAVAAYGVVSRIELLLYVPFFGSSAALSPFIGQNYGAEKYHRIRSAVLLVTKFNVIWGLFVAGFLALADYYIIRLFSDNLLTIDHAKTYFSIVPLSYAFVGLIYVTASYLNSTRQPRKALLIPIAQFLLLTIPFAMLGQYWFGLKAIYTAVFLANLIAGIGFYTYIRRSL